MPRLERRRRGWYQAWIHSEIPLSRPRGGLPAAGAQAGSSCIEPNLKANEAAPYVASPRPAAPCRGPRASPSCCPRRSPATSVISDRSRRPVSSPATSAPRPWTPPPATATATPPRTPPSSAKPATPAPVVLLPAQTQRGEDPSRRPPAIPAYPSTSPVTGMVPGQGIDPFGCPPVMWPQLASRKGGRVAGSRTRRDEHALVLSGRQVVSR